MAKDAEEVMLSSNKEGIDKVLREQGGYAFFMESTTIEYVTERYCQLQQVGGLLDSKSYGIAVQQGEYLFQVQFDFFKGAFGLMAFRFSDVSTKISYPECFGSQSNASGPIHRKVSISHRFLDLESGRFLTFNDENE